MQRIADGDGHGRADHERSASADRIADLIRRGTKFKDDLVQEPDVELLSQRVQNRTDEQGAEQTLRHRTELVDPVAAQRDLNVLALEERFEFAHEEPSVI